MFNPVLFTLMWVSGWASCDKLLRIPVYCGIFGWLGSALVVWSAGIIVIMTSCRYLSLVKPLYYRTNVTTTSVTRGVIGALIFCLVFFIWPFTGLTAPFTIYEDNHICATQFSPGGAGIGQRLFIGVTGVIGCLTVVLVLVCNLTIVKTLRQRNAIRSEVISARADGTRTNAHGKRRKFGHVTLVVSFVYALCYAPFVVRLVIDTINDTDHQNLLIHSVTLSLLFLSPLLNPIVYGVFNKQFRQTLFSMFKPGARKPGPSGSVDSRSGQNGDAYLQRSIKDGQKVKVQPERSGSGSNLETQHGRSAVQVHETDVIITGYARPYEVFSYSCE
ncbi:unnamed protein product [Lymnaea stagnalis]|uniref:G-protein coupled receptors family 1 profile domain-containing protein n=1 Tax=Lymnaea stagnalis TaxID=6523 RepID=A0AAV2I9I0_LYMST